jgi:hypothetical protein
MKCLLAIIGVGTLLAGCSKTDKAFEQLEQASWQDLAAKTQGDSAWGMDKIQHWDFSQDTGKLVFTLPDGMKATCAAQIVGTYDSGDGSWEWAWADSSISNNLTTDCLTVKNYGVTNGFKKLTEAEWQGTLTDAWDMAAITCKICGDQGVYAGPASDKLSVFFSFGPVRLSK